MEKTSSLTRVAEFSSPKLESLKKLPRISDYELPSLRQRISEMDNNDAAEETSRGYDSAGHLIDYDDYEALPESSTLTTHLIAGAFAGMAEHCVMYPVDSVKVSWDRSGKSVEARADMRHERWKLCNKDLKFSDIQCHCHWHCH